MAKNPTYRMGQKVRAVRGPGGKMEADWRNIGLEGHVIGVHKFHGSEHHYAVTFGPGREDSVDESCLERA